MSNDWVQTFPGAVTICDATGIIIDMNAKARATWAKHLEKKELIGVNVLDCHPEPARTKLARLLETHETNAYTIEKNGIKKLIYQAPWFAPDGTFAGLVELSLEIPFEMQHFVRPPTTPNPAPKTK